jgi:hypothetical protein
MTKNNNKIITGKKRPVTLTPKLIRARTNFNFKRYVLALEADLAAGAHLEHNIWMQDVLSGLSENDLYTIAITKY